MSIVSSWTLWGMKDGEGRFFDVTAAEAEDGSAACQVGRARGYTGAVHVRYVNERRG